MGEENGEGLLMLRGGAKNLDAMNMTLEILEIHHKYAPPFLTMNSRYSPCATIVQGRKRCHDFFWLGRLSSVGHLDNV